MTNYYCEKEGKVMSLVCKTLDILKQNLVLWTVLNYDEIILP